MDNLRFHMKKRHFLAQAEIVSVLSSTQSNAEKLSLAQFRFSLGMSLQPKGCLSETFPLPTHLSTLLAKDLLTPPRYSFQFRGTPG